MAEKGVVLGQTAARQLMDMMKRDARMHRNLPPPPMRQPVIREDSTEPGFWAIITDKRDFLITDESSDDPVQNCLYAIAPFSRGEYSWIEAIWSLVEGEFIPKPNGRSGYAGECDAAREVNRSNANIHLMGMVVWMRRGAAADCESSDGEMGSSDIEARHITVHGRSTNYEYWFDLGVPREDCADRYVLSADPNNDLS